MPWFKVDDGFHCHPKVLEAGNEAIGLYVRCGSWVSQQLTDGFVPTSIAVLYGGRDLAELLVEAKLWTPVVGGWRMHDYLIYNPSKEQVQAERHAASERQKRARDKAKAAREAKEAAAQRHAVTTGVTDTGSHASSHGVTAPSEVGTSDDGPDGLWSDSESHAVTAPVSHGPVTPAVTVPPSRPVPSPLPTEEEKTTTAPRTRGTRIPEDFASSGITLDLISWARDECPLVDRRRETEMFVDYWLGVPGQKGLKLDWPRTWKNRMREQQKHAERFNNGRRSGRPATYQNPPPSDYLEPDAWGTP